MKDEALLFHTHRPDEIKPPAANRQCASVPRSSWIKQNGPEFHLPSSSHTTARPHDRMTGKPTVLTVVRGDFRMFWDVPGEVFP